MLNKNVNEILRDLEMKTKLVDMGLEIEGGTPQKLADTMKKDRLKWEKVIVDANIRLDR
jgi:tripartite-type tricarboxylate transporter receptor subunit TctC